MVECKDCRTLNGLDAKFCKGCGKPISPVDLSEAVARHEKLTSDGYSAFNAGRIDEALLVAQAAVDANPSSPRAFTLLGMCYERTGQIAEALEAYERVLAISPDSPLEKLKVNQLRNGLANQLMIRPAQSKRMALVAAGLIVLIMICVATALGISNGRNAVAQQQNTSSKSTLVAQNDPDVKSFQVAGQLQQPNPGAQIQVPHPAPSTVNPTSVNNLADQNNHVTPPLIKPGGGDGSALAPFPVNTQVVPDSAGGTKAADQQPQIGDPQPGPVDPGAAAHGAAQQNPAAGQTQGNTTAAPPQEDNGIIDIQVARPSQSTPSTEDSPNRVEALVRSAKDEFLLGHYDKAAKSYERALAAGGDPATINQRLGMCYDKTGRASDAASAYTRAVAAFQAAIDSGHGDPSRLKSGLQSCQQALKVLKG